MDQPQKQVIIYKNRTNILLVSLGYDISQDTITSEIREDKDFESELIATWDVDFLTDGIDGELRFTLDNSFSAGITKSSGWMDIKRLTGGESVVVHDDPIEVIIKNTVTA